MNNPNQTFIGINKFPPVNWRDDPRFASFKERTDNLFENEVTSIDLIIDNTGYGVDGGNQLSAGTAALDLEIESSF